MRWVGRQLSRCVWCVNLAFVAAIVAIIFFCLDFGGAIDDNSIHTPAGQQGEGQDDTISESTPDRADLRLIVEQDIFGAEQRAASVEDVKGDVAESVPLRPEPMRELSLRLLGTIVAEEGSSYAVLEDRVLKSQDIYRVGDIISDVRVESIEQNKVVVLNDGVRQVLNLDLAGRASGAPVAASQRPSPPQINVNNNEIVRVVSNSERQINTRASAAGIGQATQLLSRLTISPHVANGMPDGLRISGLGDSVIAQLAGLRDGDVVHVINNHPVLDKKMAAQVLRKAHKLGAAQIQFARGQERKSLAFRAGVW